MDIFDVAITKIHSEKTLKRTVRVVIDTDCYGAKTRNMMCGFLKAEWSKIKREMCFRETKQLDEEGISFFENMEDGEWYARHFAAKLKDFSDEEIVEEFNRRMEDGLFHHITFKGRAEVEKR